MAPAAKAPKLSKKPSGKDIRSFFGGPSQIASSQGISNSQGLKRTEAIEITSEDDAGPSRKKLQITPAKPKPRTPQKQTAPVVKSNGRRVVDEDEEEEEPKPKHTSATKRKKPAVLISSDEEEEKATPPKKKVAVGTRTAKPRASLSTNKKSPLKKPTKDEDYDMSSPEEDDDDGFIDDEDEELVPTKGTKKQPKQQPKPKPKRAVQKASASQGAEGSTASGTNKPETGEEEKKKFNWAAAKAMKLAGPSAPGSKQVPDGDPNALAGLSFVFTGELTSFSRDEAADLAKRYGGRVTGQPSSKTSYVVLGEGAGPSKIAAIKKHGLKSLSEDEFLNLIGTRKPHGSADLDAKTKKKMEKDEKAIRLGAKELENREKRAAKGPHNAKQVDASSQLWTTRYAPQTLKEICGNKGQVEKLLQWLQDWPQSLKSDFKKPGKNAMNIFRAVMITGSPGIGKTTSAHLCAKLAGFTPIELNASDARSKKLVENGMNINNKSLDGWMAQSGTSGNAAGDQVMITDKTCLIMDEVDGMSAGDRGGVGALNAMIKKSKVPIICIANDRGAQKLKPLMATTFNLPFRKPEVNSIRSRILSITFKEKMKVPANVIDQLVAGAQSDIRQVLNMLSTWRLSSSSMSFDEGKDLAKMNEKYSVMSPFDITSKILGPYTFSATSRMTLNDKIDMYFNDHSFVPLFIQENYLKTQPAAVRNVEGPGKILKQLQLMDKAASSISEGDLVDALIHGPEQHWGLMPLHGVLSTVRPSSFVYGLGSGYGGPNAMSFPQWLGQNSKQNKLNRQLGDVQIRMRLKVSGDKAEIRQSYIPSLFPHIIKPLMTVGVSAVDEVIEQMDDYFLSKDDWDTLVELGVDDNKDDFVLKKISTATKTSLTKRYNSKEHPIPFHKAQDLGKVPKKLAGGPVPDLEEAYDMDDEVPDDPSDDEKKSKDSDGISGDKLIKEAKRKKGSTTQSKGKTKK